MSDLERRTDSTTPTGTKPAVKAILPDLRIDAPITPADATRSTSLAAAAAIAPLSPADSFSYLRPRPPVVVTPQTNNRTTEVRVSTPPSPARPHTTDVGVPAKANADTNPPPGTPAEPQKNQEKDADSPPARRTPTRPPSNDNADTPPAAAQPPIVPPPPPPGDRPTAAGAADEPGDRDAQRKDTSVRASTERLPFIPTVVETRPVTGGELMLNRDHPRQDLVERAAAEVADGLPAGWVRLYIEDRPQAYYRDPTSTFFAKPIGMISPEQIEGAVARIEAMDGLSAKGKAEEIARIRQDYDIPGPVTELAMAQHIKAVLATQEALAIAQGEGFVDIELVEMLVARTTSTEDMGIYPFQPGYRPEGVEEYQTNTPELRALTNADKKLKVLFRDHGINPDDLDPGQFMIWVDPDGQKHLRLIDTRHYKPLTEEDTPNVPSYAATRPEEIITDRNLYEILADRRTPEGFTKEQPIWTVAPTPETPPIVAGSPSESGFRRVNGVDVRNAQPGTEIFFVGRNPTNSFIVRVSEKDTITMWRAGQDNPSGATTGLTTSRDGLFVYDRRIKNLLLTPTYPGFLLTDDVYEPDIHPRLFRPEFEYDGDGNVLQPTQFRQEALLQLWIKEP